MLENFDDGNAAHIFDGFGVHIFERLHVLLHKVLALVHLGTERDDGIGNWDEGYDAKTPIENEHQYERGDGNDDGPCQIRKLVCHEGVCDGGIVVNDFADASGRVLVEKAKRKPEQFFHGDSADVAFDAECHQVRTNERGKVKHDAYDRENDGHQCVMLDHVV